MTCKKTQGFLETISCDVSEKVEAAKVKYAPEEALGLLKGMDKLIAMKGKKVVTFDLKNDRPDNETLLKHLIGPSGNLRAPTARVGKTLLIGFNQETYAEFLG